MIWLITLLGFILRLIKINQSLWLDEASQTTLSQMSIQQIFFGRLGDVHPPLSFIFYHFWMMISINDIWIRLLPVLFGAATIPVVYLFTKELFNKKTAILAALFLAIAPFHIYYSQEVRMYSMAAFFATLSMFFLWKEKKLGFILSTAALIYTHHIGFIVLASQVLYILFFQRKKLLTFIKQVAVVILLWLPWLPVFLQQLKNGANPDQYLPGWSSVLSLPTIKTLPLTLIKFSIGRISFDNRILYGAVSAVVGVIFSFLIICAVRNLKKNNYLIIFWLFGTVLLSVIISIGLPIYETQRMIVVLPTFFVLAAFGVSNLRKFQKTIIGFVLVISLGGLLVYWTNPKFQREDWKGATSFVDTEMLKASLINKTLANSSASLFVWPQPFDPYIWYGGKNGVGLAKKFPANAEEISQNLIPLGSKKQLYLFEYLQGLSDPKKIAQQVLTENGYHLVQVYNFNGVGFVDLYQKP